jgi:glycosyltransferase involved in cell wall biosynthesis
MVSNLNLDQNVRFLGWLEHDRILDLYLAYDVLLFPSRWEEPGGGTILEAMARGLPVIASSRGGALDVIRDGKNGLMVPADDPTALAEAILRLIQNDNLVQKIRHEAIKTIRDRFTLERVVDLDLQYIERVLASRPLPLDHGRPV